jgi:hypothetical protein
LDSTEPANHRCSYVIAPKEVLVAYKEVTMCQIEAVVSMARDIVVPAAVVVAHRFFMVKVLLVLKTCQRLSATPRQKVVIRKHIIAI